MKKNTLDWVDVLKGKLCLHSFPAKNLVPSLSALGVTTIVTLTGGQKSKTLGTQIEKQGIKWVHLPLKSNELPQDPDHIRNIVSTVRGLRDELQKGARVFIHCQSGLQRTGMIAHLLLLLCGLSEEETRDTIARARAKTLTCVGDERLRWGTDVFGSLSKTSI